MTQETLYKKNATIADTIGAIVEMINRWYPTEFVGELVKRIGDPKDKEKFIRQTFDFVADNIPYIDDPRRTGKDGHESVWSPATTILEGRGDCKKMTVLIASILKHAGINPLLKHVYYDNEDFTHIYVIVPYPKLPHYITVDPVNDKKYNSEVQHSFGSVYDLNGNKMDVYMGNKPGEKKNSYGFKSDLGDLATRIDADLYAASGAAIKTKHTTREHQHNILNEILSVDLESPTMGRHRKSKEERKEQRRKLFDKFKQIGLVAPRGAFLAIVDLNGLRMADKLALAISRDQNSVYDLWEKVGGDPNALLKAVKNGAGKKLMGITTSGSIGFAVAAAIAAATPVLIAVQDLLKKLKADGNANESQATDDAIDKAADDVNSGTTPMAPTDQHVKDAVQNADNGGTIPQTASLTNTPTDQTAKGGDDFSFTHPLDFLNAIVKAPLYITAGIFIFHANPIFFWSGIAGLTFYSLKKFLKNG